MPKYRVQYFTKKANGKTYRHPWLGYRQRNKNGTPTFVAVVSLVRMPDEVVEALDRSLKSGGGEAGEVLFLDSENIGAAWVAWRIGERLGILEALSRLEEPYRRMVTVMVLDRVLADRPSSKLDLWERMKTDKAVLGKVACLPEGRPLAEWYTALDKLLAAQSAMELELFERRNGSAERIFLYDITSSYFEGEHCPIADYGYNRDGKKGKKQIVIGLLTDHGGMPVSVEVFQGNTSDKTTVLDQVRKARDRFGVKELVFVGDRGMLTSSNRVALTADEFAGIRYVSALPRAELAELVEERATPIEDDLFTRKELFEMAVDGKRTVFKHNPLRMTEDGETRIRLLEKTAEKLAALKRSVTAGKLKNPDVIAKRLYRWLNNWNVGKFFTTSYDEGRFDYALDEEKVEMAQRFDGWFAVVSDLPPGDHTSAELVERYKSLKHVESAFRAMKTTDLFLRPIRHWNPNRVRGHVFLCMLSYMITLEARRLFTDFLAPVRKSEDDEIFRQSLARLWATLNTVKTGKLSIAGKETVQVSPITNEVRALLKTADAAIGKEAKERFGVSL